MNKKKNIIFLSVGVITLIVAVLGATYAYFIAQGGGSANTDVNVGTSTTDNLSFSFGDLININANEVNFAEGMGSITDSTTGTAILKANNATNEANSRYNIYLIIENNDFIYTTEEGTPEILLNVTDPNGKKLENITGLVHYEDGFDITTRTGGFLIVPDYEISAIDKETIQDWQVEVTLVNLDTDQNKNTNKTLTGKLYLTQEQMSSYELTEINNIETTTTYNSINATLDITNGSALVNKYYYGIEKVNNTRSATTVEYIETTNPNYEFTNLEANTEYTIYSYVEDENKIKSNVYSTNITTDEYEMPIINSVNHSVTLNSITLNVTATKGSNEIAKYMYSKDNGSTWEESTSNSYTFNNLKDTTEYKIKVKVIDSEGYESTEYYEAITTEVYILPVVSSVKTTTTWNSITLTPSGTNGTNTISKYMYSINGGTYQESNVFNNLSDNTKYTIKVKVIDSANRESNEYTLEVTTDEYKLPTINNVTLSSTYNSITINVDASNGDGNIVSYHYSKDDGSNYTKSSSNSYTFNSLTSDTTFYIKVYVTDSNGRVSSVTSKSIATNSYKLPTINNVTLESTKDSITVKVDASNGDGRIVSYHYSKDDGSNYTKSSDNSYTFSGLTSNTTFYIKVYVTDNNGRVSAVTSKSIATKANYLVSYITEELYTSDGTNGLYYHDGTGSYENANQEAGDNSYRYAGANPNNYVCFGTDASTCPSDNLYRIIGVFGNQVKLIKNTSIGNYYWSGSSSNSSNTWSSSTLNTSTLNGTYLNGLGSKWSNLIATTSWKVGGMAWSSTNTAKKYYNVELGSSSSSTTYSAKIGLMYVSDYGYAASPENWTTELYNYDNSTNKNNNWMYLGSIEWTISRRSDYTDRAFVVYDTGRVYGILVNFGNRGVRPSFYLESTVEFSGGSGTQTDPYRISI